MENIYPDFKKMRAKEVATFGFYNCEDLEKQITDPSIERYEKIIEEGEITDNTSFGNYVFEFLVEKLKKTIEENPTKKIVFSVID